MHIETLHLSAFSLSYPTTRTPRVFLYQDKHAND